MYEPGKGNSGFQLESYCLWGQSCRLLHTMVKTCEEPHLIYVSKVAPGCTCLKDLAHSLVLDSCKKSVWSLLDLLNATELEKRSKSCLSFAEVTIAMF